MASKFTQRNIAAGNPPKDGGTNKAKGISDPKEFAYRDKMYKDSSELYNINKKFKDSDSFLSNPEAAKIISRLSKNNKGQLPFKFPNDGKGNTKSEAEKKGNVKVIVDKPKQPVYLDKPTSNKKAEKQVVATKTSVSNVKPSTADTKKTTSTTKPVMKEKGVVDTNVYIIRDPQNEYAYREVKRGTKGAQGMTPSQYAKLKSSVGPMKKG